MIFKYVSYVGIKVSKQVYNMSEAQVIKLAKLIINKTIDDSLFTQEDVSSLFLIQKDNEGTIKSIDYNTQKANKMLFKINEKVYENIKELENGKSSIINIDNKIARYLSKKNGVFLEIPLGVALNNTLISNIGPKIPVKLSINGDVFSKLDISNESYGINTIIIKISAYIEVTEQIILPQVSKEITISTTVPIAIKMIQGEVPSNYFGNYNK